MNIGNRTGTVLVPADLDSAIKRLASLRGKDVEAVAGELLREGLLRESLLVRPPRVGREVDVVSAPSRNFR
jgi:hypothetical protein